MRFEAACDTCATLYEVRDAETQHRCGCGGLLIVTGELPPSPPPADRHLRVRSRIDLDRACTTLGTLRVFYLINLAVLVFLAARATGAPVWELLHRVFLFGVMLHGFLYVTSNPLFWTLVAAVTQTVHLLHLMRTGGIWVHSMVWMVFLWSGVHAAWRVERVLNRFPDWKPMADRAAWLAFRKSGLTILLILALPMVFVLFLATRLVH